MLIEFREKKTRRKQTNVVFHALGQQEGEKTTRKVRMKMGLLTCSVWAWFQWTSNSGAPKLLLKNSSWIPQKDKQMIFYITQKRNQMSSTTQRDFSGMNLLLLLSGQSSSTADTGVPGCLFHSRVSILSFIWATGKAHLNSGVGLWFNKCLHLLASEPWRRYFSVSGPFSGHFLFRINKLQSKEIKKNLIKLNFVYKKHLSF